MKRGEESNFRHLHKIALVFGVSAFFSRSERVCPWFFTVSTATLWAQLKLPSKGDWLLVGGGPKLPTKAFKTSLLQARLVGGLKPLENIYSTMERFGNHQSAVHPKKQNDQSPVAPRPRRIAALEA